MTTLAFGVEMTVITCKCGGSYAINERFRERKHQEGGTWNCPYCKVQWGYSGRGENAQLKKELADERHRREMAQADARHHEAQRRAAERKVVAEKGAKTKLKKRAAAGVCPCCNRSFHQLREHIAEKHPEFQKEVGVISPKRARPS